MDTVTPPHASQARADDSSRRTSARSTTGLLSDLWRESTSLVQDELALAKAEMSEKGKALAAGAQAVAIGGAVLFAGFIMVLLAAANALAMVLPRLLAPWLAPLAVGAVVIVIGYLLLAGGRRKAAADQLQPTRSLDSLRKDRNLVKEHLP